MGKRIRYPKKKEQKIEQENKNQQTNETKTNFVLDVHSSVIGTKTKIGK